MLINTLTLGIVLLGLPSVGQETTQLLPDVTETRCGADPVREGREQLQAQIEELKEKVGRDGEAIRRQLGATASARDFDDWLALSRTSRDKFEEESLKALWEGLQTAGFQVAGATVDAASKLNPFSAQKAIGRLNTALGPKSRPLWQVLRALGKTQGKPEIARLIHVGINYTDHLNDLRNLNDDKDATGAELFATVLSWGLEGPGAYFLGEMKWTFASLYNTSAQWTSADQIARLTDMNENSLLALRSLQCTMEKHIKTLLAARRALHDTHHKASRHTGLIVAGVVGGTALLVGGAAAIGSQAQNGGAVSGRCDGTSPSNACGACTCTPSVNCNPSPQCGGGACFTSGNGGAPFCQ